MKMRILPAITLAFLLASPCFATGVARYKASVTNVIDGDTIMIDWKRDPSPAGRYKRRPEGPINLDAVDAPELDQPGGEEAKQFLTELLLGKEILVVELIDYGNSLGAWVTRDGECINLLLVQHGHAWLGKFNVHGQREREAKLPAALAAAKEKKMGIWKQKAPIPPSEWRNRNQGDGQHHPGP